MFYYMLVMRVKFLRKSLKMLFICCGSFYKSSGVFMVFYERNEKIWGIECYVDSVLLCVVIILGWVYVEVCY